MRKYGVLGSGVVARVLATGLKRHGYEVSIGSRDPGKLAAFRDEAGIPIGTFSDVAGAAEVAVLAVKGTVASDALRLAGADRLAGKVVIDTTNPIADAPPDRRRPAVLYRPERVVDGAPAGRVPRRCDS